MVVMFVVMVVCCCDVGGVFQDFENLKIKSIFNRIDEIKSENFEKFLILMPTWLERLQRYSNILEGFNFFVFLGISHFFMRSRRFSSSGGLGGEGIGVVVGEVRVGGVRWRVGVLGDAILSENRRRVGNVKKRILLVI